MSDDEQKDHLSLMIEAMREMDKAQTACWKCTEAFHAGHLIGGGTWEFAVFRTLKDGYGRCVNCQHHNTARQTKVLAAKLANARRQIGLRLSA